MAVNHEKIPFVETRNRLSHHVEQALLQPALQFLVEKFDISDLVPTNEMEAVTARLLKTNESLQDNLVHVDWASSRRKDLLLAQIQDLNLLFAQIQDHEDDELTTVTTPTQEQSPRSQLSTNTRNVAIALHAPYKTSSLVDAEASSWTTVKKKKKK